MPGNADRIHDILLKYWGYTQFRPLQQDIVESVLQGKDTLALLPTGGGKSICFQVPALALEGITLVISPLIALMQDQVQHLQQKNIAACAITSNQKRVEWEFELEKAKKLPQCFVYLSPERLQSEAFTEWFPYLDVRLIAIDEAHCISQWGYDFRPSYLKIAALRSHFPHCPIIALTATATPEVKDDIMRQLHFRKGAQVFVKSFARANLNYIILKEEAKLERMLKILSRVPGTSVVYVRNRRKTEEVAKQLRNHGVESWHYHAGLDKLTRKLRQQRWIDNDMRAMVCTNAFGMGIDKPDVRSVIHLDLPESIEAYFQEAGRAGRDEQRSYAVMLYDAQDINAMQQRLAAILPPFEQIKNIYNWVCNRLNIAVGAAESQAFAFDLRAFCTAYQLSPLVVVSALKYLENEGLLGYLEQNYNPSKVKVLLDRNDFYQFELKHPRLDPLFKILLRGYSGLFSDFVAIDEDAIAQKLGVTKKEVIKILEFMHQVKALHYIKESDQPQIFLPLPRQHPERLPLSLKQYELRKANAQKKLQAMLDFVQNNTTCRQEQLLAYFGETDAAFCGKCDVCLAQKRGLRSKLKADKKQAILRLLKSTKTGLNLAELELKIYGEKALLLDALNELVEQEEVSYFNKRYFITSDGKT